MTNPGGCSDAEMMEGVRRTAAHMREMTDAEDARERGASRAPALPDGWTIHEREWSDGAVSLELGNRDGHVMTAFRASRTSGWTCSAISAPDGFTVDALDSLTRSLAILHARIMAVR